ncbi:PAS domain-containing protein [Salinibaculum salinum]|uniref:PAS domain-containing protein n=1 Tax=Salinibaculum salinum TaxID=3131996 RepID=UPI0030EC6346
MTADPTINDGRPTMDEKPRLLLFSVENQNQRLLAEALGDRYQIETVSDPAALHREFDCCLLTEQRLPDVAEIIEQRQAETPAFLPFLLLSEDGDVDPEIWEYVDDIVTLPVKKASLHARIENLVKRRQTARQLAERERELQETVDDLRLKERTIDKAPVGFSIADSEQDDEPLVYVNDQFLEMSGYTGKEVLGRNCRFLQGDETDEETVTQVRDAIDTEQPISVDIVNYRKSGQKFWNNVVIAPVRKDGEVTHYVGFQADVTDRKVRERRQEVLNRVLSHNFRNKMNVIKAYTELLRDGIDGDPPKELANIETAAEDLLRLAETARKTDQILSETESDERLLELDERLERLTDTLRDQYPDVTIELTLPEDGASPVAAGGLPDALREALENAAKHNDGDDPRVCIRVENRDSNWVDIEITDNGPGIPDRELDVLDDGEDALRHADRMGIWLIYWTVTRAGGTMTVDSHDDGGTTVSLAVPAVDRA